MNTSQIKDYSMNDTTRPETPRRKKVLLIDDEIDFCFFIKLNLEKTGKYDVLTTTNAETGLIMVSKELPDLVLLDIIMPDMNGGQVAGLLLDDPKTKDIPVLFITAIASRSETHSQEGIIGGRMFIAKPVTTEELANKIDSVLNQYDFAFSKHL
jgi:CheY-like chemotaxis protein